MELFDNKASIAFFKVDVEGFEFRIIKGAQKLLKSGNIESFVMEMKLHTFEDTRMMITLFFESGFDLYKSYKTRSLAIALRKSMISGKTLQM
jgi:hypothetical protein